MPPTCLRKLLLFVMQFLVILNLVALFHFFTLLSLLISHCINIQLIMYFLSQWKGCKRSVPGSVGSCSRLGSARRSGSSAQCGKMLVKITCKHSDRDGWGYTGFGVCAFFAGSIARSPWEARDSCLRPCHRTLRQLERIEQKQWGKIKFIDLESIYYWHFSL